MRALIATAVVILIALLAAIGLGAFGRGEASPDNRGLDSGQVDIEMIGGKGPGFDVETGSAAPGEQERRAESGSADDGSEPGADREDMMAGDLEGDASGPQPTEPRNQTAAPVPAQP